MAQVEVKKPTSPSGGWSDLLKKEDYWAVWIGLGITFIAMLFWASGSSFIKSIAIAIPTWSDFGVASKYLNANFGNIIFMFLGFMLLFLIAIKILGYDVKKFIIGFIVLLQ